MSSPTRTRRRQRLRRISRCPDCNSTVRIVSDAPNQPHAQVEHDETCPWFAARGGRAFRELRLTPFGHEGGAP